MGYVDGLYVGLCLGMGGGFALCWSYFLLTGLIRSRYEYYAARKARGLWVPDDWESKE